ncbi:Fe-S cluster assembly protein SufD [Staphylospora marina]|uniref:Fe-S cluster assembly protein SufD n=1 Tax=Staphylospora marina TaxID=2490858 RepID=UPI000F5C195E|nr:Fe-S cluster assembly protein SufD [Staphylospora marina]
MNVETPNLVDKQVVEERSRQANEPKWLTEARLEALAAVSSLPLPRPERTDIRQWNFTAFEPFAAEPAVGSIGELPEEIREFLFEGGQGVIVQKNASVIYSERSEELAAKGVIFTDLVTAAREHEEWVKTFFMTEGVKRDEHKLTALHAALTTGGLFVHVPKNTEVTGTLQGLFWLNNPGNGIVPHVIVSAEPGSRLDLVLGFVGTGDAGVNNAVIEVFVGENAEVRVATVNNLGKDTVDATWRRSVVKKDGRLEWIIADLSSGRVLSDNTVRLVEKGGTVRIKGVTFGAGSMRANVTNAVYHHGEHTESDIHVRSVMKDEASSIVNSITKIEKGARKSDGQQSSKVLMLNPKARGDANPILLIDENDVKAGHAASVGRIDPIQLYYLMSRGIPQAEAEKLIINGFLDAVISEIPSEALRERIHRVIERKFRS